ncbi:MAG: hypothetical protein PHO26_07245 [Dehalococcoidia bacterium]|nr:hypothetical protein [Dehalococcoidia bacterium]MDD5495229.1 hypothetical protein [Dehalococcoidia bacterium]
MTKDSKIRINWMRGMYICTIIVAGLCGLGMLIMPGFIRSVNGWPADDPIFFGIVGSIWAASGILAILGLRDPLKFSPLFLMQLFYKSLWFIFIFAPLAIAGKFPAYGMSFVVIFAIFIIGDIIATPFSYLFKKQS